MVRIGGERLVGSCRLGGDWVVRNTFLIRNLWSLTWTPPRGDSGLKRPPPADSESPLAYGHLQSF